MRVLQLSKYYDPVRGGIELVARLVTKAFVDDGHEVDVIAFSDKDLVRAGRFGESVEEILEDVFILSTPMSFNFLFRFRDLLLQKKYDRIYVHLPNPFMHEVIRHYHKELVACGTRVIGIYHSDILNKAFLGDLYQTYFRRTSSVYDELICSSPKLISTSPTLRDLPPHKLKVIPFCVDETGGFKERRKFSGNLIAIGRMVPYKGYEFLIDAINHTPYQLTIIGNGPLYSKLKALAGPNVTLKGHVNDEEKDQLMNAADVLVVSSNSRAEAYGMTIVEAFEKGLPAVVSNIDSGVTFLVSDQKTGLTFTINDKKDFLSKLSQLSARPELLNLLSVNCHKFHEQELSFKAFQAKLLT